MEEINLKEINFNEVVRVDFITKNGNCHNSFKGYIEPIDIVMEVIRLNNYTGLDVYAIVKTWYGRESEIIF